MIDAALWPHRRGAAFVVSAVTAESPTVVAAARWLLHPRLREPTRAYI